MKNLCNLFVAIKDEANFCWNSLNYFVYTYAFFSHRVMSLWIFLIKQKTLKILYLKMIVFKMKNKTMLFIN